MRSLLIRHFLMDGHDHFGLLDLSLFHDGLQPVQDLCFRITLDSFFESLPPEDLCDRPRSLLRGHDFRRSGGPHGADRLRLHHR